MEPTTEELAKPITDLITKLSDIASNVLDIYIIPISGALLVILIIWTGIKYITGGPKAEESAKKAFVAIFIGVAIMMLAYVIINLVQRLIT